MVSRPLHLKLMNRLSRGLGWALVALGVCRVGFSLLGELSSAAALLPVWMIGVMITCGLLLLAGHGWIKYALRRLPEADGLTYDRLLLLGQMVQLGVVLFLYALLQGPIELALLAGFPAVVAHWLGYPGTARIMNGLVVLALLAWLPFGYPTLTTASAGGWIVASLVPVIGLYAHAVRLMGQLDQQARGQVTHLSTLATTDPLTGLMNRRSLNVRLSAEVARAKRYNMPLSVALFDLDDFKQVNDHYGHPVGDILLHELSQLLLLSVRESDMLVRYGGEEFALILPETKQLAAYDLMERLRAKVAQHPFCKVAGPLSVTLSIGLTQFDPHRNNALQLVEEADQALYLAKGAGKNQVVIYGLKPHAYTATVPPLPEITPSQAAPAAEAGDLRDQDTSSSSSAETAPAVVAHP
jgi:diguanylate cyclase (GGDEF)-like protein